MVLMRLPTLCILALVVGCNHDAIVQTTTTKLADPVQLAHVGEEWDAYGNFLTVLRLTNRSAADISYAGYGTSSPIYLQQVRGSDLEGWRDQKSGWCGVGLERQHLPAGQSATFTVLPPDAAQSWRIGIKLESSQSQVIWTQPIISNSDIAPQGPSAAELVQADFSRHPDRDFPYTFTLKNVSRTPLCYGGYQEPHVPPIYLIQEKHSEGWEDKGKADWSGTGFGFKELPPGGSISFSVPAQSLDSTWRIGLRLFKTARPASCNDAYRPVWWAPLPPRNRA
jgi:hypothetical protein